MPFYSPQLLSIPSNTCLYPLNHCSFSVHAAVSVPPSPPSDQLVSSSDGVVGLPIDFDVASKIEGAESQIVTITLQPNQVLRAESGAMLYMSDGITMTTTMGGGLSAGFKRMLTGQNFFISDYTYTGPTRGVVALGTDFPSKIIRLNVKEYGGKIVCQQGALLCASHTIDIEMEFTKKFSTGFFGGEGFVLQSLVGTGDVFVKAGGALIRRDLAPGEVLRISSGCLVAFSFGVEYGTWAVLVFPIAYGTFSHQKGSHNRLFSLHVHHHDRYTNVTRIQKCTIRR